MDAPALFEVKLYTIRSETEKRERDCLTEITIKYQNLNEYV